MRLLRKATDMMKSILHRITSALPCRLITDKGRPYLERYYVGTLFGVRCYIHRFVASDPDRGLHDHPWPWAFSIVLAGAYYEITRSGIDLVRRFNVLNGDSFHRVLLSQRKDGSAGEQECWTLFFHRAKDVKTWGFLRQASGIQVTDVMVWQAYNYAKSNKFWWKTAPLGRDCPGRLPEVA